MLSLRLKAIGLTQQLDSLFLRLPGIKRLKVIFSNYWQTVTVNLRGVKIPYSALSCRDVNCCNVAHQMALDMYSNQISEALLSAARSTIPKYSDKRSSCARVPGWSEYVDPLRTKSMFGHNLWVECGRPRSGVVADVMRHTRASHHYAVRRVKLNKFNILNERFAESILSDTSHYFCSEVKRLRSTMSRSSPSSMVDNFTKPDDISSLLPKNIRNCTLAEILIKSR